MNQDAPIVWARVIGLYAVTLLVYSGFGVIQPIFPVWAAQFSSSMTEIGMATTLSAGVGLIGARPLAAWLMEGRHRSPTLALGALVSAASAFVMPSLDTLGAVILARATQGLGFGLVATAALAAVLDMAPASRRGQLVGYFGASTALALFIGPLLGGLVAARWSLDATFYVTGVLCLSGISAPFFIREASVGAARQGFSFAVVLEVPGLMRLTAIHFFGILIHGVLLTYLPLRLEEHSGWVQADIFFGLEAGAVVLIRLFFGGRFDGLGRRVFLVLGLGSLSLAGVGLGLAQTDLELAMTALVYGVGFGFYLPMIYATAGDIIPLAARVRGLAVVLLAFDLAVAGGGIALGPLADAAGPAAALGWATIFPAFGCLLVVFGGSFRRVAASP